MKESVFQSNLKRELKNRYPGCMILKNDPTFIHGIPDLLILYNSKWAALECKSSYKDFQKSRSNKTKQEYYISKMNEMSYASFVYPENKDLVLNELDKRFQT